MIRSNLCDYADAYILVNGRITITGAEADAATRQTDEKKIRVQHLKILRHLLNAYAE